MSFVSLPSLNLTSLIHRCSNVRTIIAFGVFIGQIIWNMEITRPCQLSMMDLSDPTLPTSILCFVTKISDIHNAQIDMRKYNAFSNVRTLQLNNICQRHAQAHYFKNVTGISLLLKDSPHIKNLSFKRNQLSYVDVQLVDSIPTLESLSLSENFMEYLSPDLISSFPSLKHFDLSNNSLHIMNLKNISEFSRLLSSLINLQTVNLAQNNLDNIPHNLFLNNSNLLSINMSKNELTNVMFNTASLSRLQLLDLSQNKITFLSSHSIQTLELLFSNKTTQVLMQKNPLRCDKCQHLDYISWLLANKKNILLADKIQCMNVGGSVVFIDGLVTKQLK